MPRHASGLDVSRWVTCVKVNEDVAGDPRAMLARVGAYGVVSEALSLALSVKLPVGGIYPRPGDGINASLMCYALELRKLERPLGPIVMARDEYD